MAIKLPVSKSKWNKLTEKEKRDLLEKENKSLSKNELNNLILSYSAAGYLILTAVERKILIDSIKITDISTPINKRKWNKLTNSEKNKIIEKERKKIEGKPADIILSKRDKDLLEDDGWSIVKSTWLIAIRKTNNDLDVKFKSGITLRYANYGDLFDEMSRAVSKGAYGHAHNIFTRRSFGGASYILI